MVVSRDGSGAKSAGEGDGGPGRVKDGVVSELKRRREGLALQTQTEKEEGKEAKEEPPTDAFVSNSLETGLSSLAESYGEKEKLGKVFVIGGAEIYGAALRMRGGPVRIIMTHVQRKGVEVNGFPCDTFFPVSEGFPAPEEGWRTVDEDEVSEWVGEKVSSKWRDEGEVLIRVVGYERSV